MDFEIEIDEDSEIASLQNEFTGSLRESNDPPGPDEEICLISYEPTFILLAGGPDCRSSFWKSYRRELKLNRETDYRNYHVAVCRHHLKSLRMKLDQPIYFRENRLTSERPLDA